MEFRLPELGEGVYEAELVAWLVKPGDSVKRGQNLMEVLTDKATMEVPSPFTGTIDALKAESGQQIKVGDVVLSYASSSPAAAPLSGDGAKEESNHRSVPTAPAPEKQASTRKSRISSAVLRSSPGVRAAPSVRYLARKLGVDLAQVHGSGPGGRVLVEDLTAQLQPAKAEAKKPVVEPHPEYGKPGTRLKLQGLRRKIAEHMVAAKRAIPHYSYVDESDVTALVRLRESLRETYQQAGVKLTYLAFFVKAVAGALKEVPIINSTFDEEKNEIVLHDRYNIGVAVSTANGLIVPVVRDADRKNLGEIGREIERLSSEARAGKSRLEDLRGGTFTVTSIGNVGGLISTPVINHPEVAILGVGKIIKRPVYDSTGSIRPADLLYLSLSFDHRVVDGAVGAAFGNEIARRLQNPATLLVDFPSLGRGD